jgi:hypothetical protein
VATLQVASNLVVQQLTPTRVSGTTVTLDLPSVQGNSLSVVTIIVPRQ